MTPFLSRKPVLVFLLVLPIAVFFVYFFALRYDIPWFDEYENIPYFLQRFLDAQSAGERLDALMKPNNEHRVLYARLVVYAQYLLTGQLSFSGLMLWGNLGLVLIFWLLYRTTQTIQPQLSALMLMLPVPLLLFTAQDYLLTFTAIYTLQYLAIIVLVVSTFFVLAYDRPAAFAGALGLGALATFSMGNGILLWPAGAIMLVMRRRWLWLGAWLAVGGLCIWLYFRGYPVQQGNAEGFAYVLKHPVQTIAGFFIFAGSVFDFFPVWPVAWRSALPLIMGVHMVGMLAFWLVRLVFRRQVNRSHFETFLAGVTLFLLANMALIALFRIRFYFAMVLHSSYRPYAMVLWAVGYLVFMSLLSPRRRQQLVVPLWGLFLGINVLCYVTYLPEAIQRRKHMQGLAFNQRHNQIGLGGTYNSALARWIIELDSTMRVRHWHTLPDPAITPDEARLVQPVVSTTQPASFRMQDQPGYFNIESDQPGYRIGMNEGTYVVFWPTDSSSRKAYVMFAELRKPTGKNPFSRPNGWLTSMPKDLLPPGQYAIGLFETTPDKSELKRTDQVVTVE